MTQSYESLNRQRSATFSTNVSTFWNFPTLALKFPIINTLPSSQMEVYRGIIL